MLEVKGNKIYAANTVDEALVHTAQLLLDCTEEIHVSFDVTGRTLHECLAHQLHSRLGTDNYGAEIEYMSYKCRIYKKPVILLLTVQVSYAAATGHSLQHTLKRAFTSQENLNAYLAKELSRPIDMKQLLGDLYVKGDVFITYGDVTIEHVKLT